MGVEDNYYEIPDLNANTTFYDWVVKENTEIIEKLNYIDVYSVAGSTGINVLIGTTGTTGTTAGTAVISVADTISGVTVSGNLIVTGYMQAADGTTSSTFVTSVNGQTGDVIIGLTGATGIQGPTGPAGTTPDPIFISQNQLINSNFDIWQRGTSFTGKFNTYFADRWARFASTATLAKLSSGTIQRNSFSQGQTDVLGTPSYYATVSLNHSGVTSGDFVGYENRVEGPDKFIGEKVYVDGYLRMQGSTGATVDVYLRRSIDGSTYTTQEFSDRVFVPGTTWTSFLVGHTVSYASGATFTDDGYVAVGIKVTDIPTGMTLEMANIRTFATQGVTLTDSPFREETDIEQELQKCSRFYQRSYDLDKLKQSSSMLSSTNPDFSPVRFTVTPEYEYYHDFSQDMRTTPTLSLYSPQSGVTGEGFNKSAGLDMRLTSGTVGWNGQTRVHVSGAPTLATTSNTKGIIFDVLSGAVIFDEIFVHFVADSDYNI